MNAARRATLTCSGRAILGALAADRPAQAQVLDAARALSDWAGDGSKALKKPNFSTAEVSTMEGGAGLKRVEGGAFVCCSEPLTLDTDKWFLIQARSAAAVAAVVTIRLNHGRRSEHAHMCVCRMNR